MVKIIGSAPYEWVLSRAGWGSGSHRWLFRYISKSVDNIIGDLPRQQLKRILYL
jgi:hypothetical protein